MAFLLFFGIMQATLGGLSLEDFTYLQGPLKHGTIIMVSASIMVAFVGAAVVAQRARPPSRARMVAGIVLAVARIVVGFRYDIGPMHVVVGSPFNMPSMLLRGCLTATGTIGWFLIISSIALRARAHEQREIASYRLTEATS
jgi:hypothetical protein